jgi:acyl carrier protein
MIEKLEKRPNTLALESWLAALVADLMGIPVETIDVRARFDRYGVDSAAAVSLTDELERHLERELEPTLLYEHPTIENLAAHLTEG